MSHEPDQPVGDYLWDRSGEPDPLVQRLEQALAPLAHDGRPLQLRPDRRRRLLPLALLPAAALSLWIFWPEAEQLPLRLRGADTVLRENDWLRTGTETKTLELKTLAQADLGRFVIHPGSRLQVRRLRQEQTLLALAEGSMRAYVFDNARPRFFQVETPATRCVDLGCEYTLKVDPEGRSRVHVLTGQVAFAVQGREIYIPSGAVCRADPQGGVGTPRWADCPDELRELLDKVDAAPLRSALRARSSAKVLAWIRLFGSPRDSLMAWQQLHDPDSGVVGRALAWIQKHHGLPVGVECREGDRPSAAQVLAIRKHLERHW